MPQQLPDGDVAPVGTKAGQPALHAVAQAQLALADELEHDGGRVGLGHAGDPRGTWPQPSCSLTVAAAAPAQARRPEAAIGARRHRRLRCARRGHGRPLPRPDAAAGERPRRPRRGRPDASRHARADRRRDQDLHGRRCAPARRRAQAVPARQRAALAARPSSPTGATSPSASCWDIPPGWATSSSTHACSRPTSPVTSATSGRRASSPRSAPSSRCSSRRARTSPTPTPTTCCSD